MRGKKILELLAEQNDRLVEIEKNQNTIIKSLEQGRALATQTHVEALAISMKLDEKKTQADKDEEFLNSMKNKDGLYSRTAIKARKKLEQEGES